MRQHTPTGTVDFARRAASSASATPIARSVPCVSRGSRSTPRRARSWIVMSRAISASTKSCLWFGGCTERPVADDPYLYPGTQTLRNIRSIRNPEELAKIEASLTYVRIIELHERPVVGNFDRAHLQAIHKHIFQDVYPWAGKAREGAEIAKPGSPFFAFSQYIAPSLDKVAAQLKSEDQLRGLSADTFSIRAGHYLGELNAIHPFREGNGRTQQEFIRELALQAGHTLEWTRITREQCIAPRNKF